MFNFLCDRGGASHLTPVLIIPTYKLHSQVDSFAFNDETDVLVGE